jgi:hypothetical protein
MLPDLERRIVHRLDCMVPTEWAMAGREVGIVPAILFRYPGPIPKRVYGTLDRRLVLALQMSEPCGPQGVRSAHLLRWQLVVEKIDEFTLELP